MLSNVEFLAVSALVTVFSPNVTEFRRIFITKLACPVYGTAHGRLNKKNQSVVKYSVENDTIQIEFGIVKSFIQVQSQNQDVYNVVLLHPFSIAHGLQFGQTGCYKIVSQYEDLQCIFLTSIQRVCNIIQIEGNTIVTEFPNCHEKD